MKADNILFLQVKLLYDEEEIVRILMTSAAALEEAALCTTAVSDSGAGMSI